MTTNQEHTDEKLQLEVEATESLVPKLQTSIWYN